MLKRIGIFYKSHRLRAARHEIDCLNLPPLNTIAYKIIFVSRSIFCPNLSIPTLICPIFTWNLLGLFTPKNLHSVHANIWFENVLLKSNILV